MPRFSQRPPFRLTASLLVASAVLAACGGGSKDSNNNNTPSPNPNQVLDAAFTRPVAVENVYDANAPVFLEVRVDLDGNPVANNNSVTFDAPSASFVPREPSTVGGLATSTLRASQVGPLQVRATANVGNRSATINRTLYIRPERKDLGVLVPAYFSGGKDSPWDTLATGAKSYPDVKITAVLNPMNDGDLDKADSAVTDSIAEFKAARRTLTNAAPLEVIGYVRTRYGSSADFSLADVQRTIDLYLTYYPEVDGFFLDEMNSDISRLKFYQDIYRYIKGKNRNLRVVGNPGTFPHPDYAGTVDALVTFEGKENDYRTIDPQPNNTWVYNYANTAQIMLVHSADTCSAMQNAVQLADKPRTHAGTVYVTDSHLTNTGNPWARLPQYWSNLMGTVDAINKGVKLPDC